jgi:hypothetical protein
LSKLISWNVFCMIFSGNFKVLSFILRTFINFELILMQGKKSAYVCSVYPALSINMSFFLQHMSVSPLSRTGWFYLHGLLRTLFWFLYSIPLTYVFVFILMPCLVLFLSFIYLFNYGFVV